MRLLILGGTVFLGRHLVDAALARGHTVTLFNRGRSGAGLFPEVERLTGDRDGGLAALRGRTWDAVIDTCGYVPRVVAQSADLLRDAVGHYTFVSSISVYADGAALGVDESAPVAKLDDPTVETITGETYGPLKALCEAAVRDATGDRAFIVRPGLLVGPRDPSGRFTYWVTRIADGGDVLAPGDREMQVQFIDARDGAEWMLRCAEAGITGVQNMTGPREALTMGGFLEAGRTALNPDARFEWVAETFLLERGVTPWTEVPLWIPSTDRGVLAVSIEKALASGLRFRPLASTLADTLAWRRSADADRPLPERVAAGPRPQMGLAPERERALLEAWRGRATAGAAP
jgi:2'-hydroxyisoflavone reductase